MKTHIIIISVMLLVSGSLLNAQVPNASSELERIQDARSNIQSQRIAIKLFEGWYSNTLIEEEKAELMRQEKNALMKFGQVEFLMTEKYLLNLDHDTKTAFLSERPEENPMESFEMDFTGLVEAAASSTVKTEEEMRICTIQFAEGKYDRIEMAYDPASYVMEKVTLYLNEARIASDQDEPVRARMEIHYDQLPTPNANLLSLSAYIKNIEKAPQLSSKWASYRLISTL